MKNIDLFIPPHVWGRTDLSLHEKVIFGIIRGAGGATAKEVYTELSGKLMANRISMLLKLLEKKELIKKEGRERFTAI